MIMPNSRRNGMRNLFAYLQLSQEGITPLNTALYELRRSKKLYCNGLAQIIHERCPVYSVGNIQAAVLPSFEGRHYSWRHYARAMRGEEPERSLLVLYINALNPDEEQMQTIRTLAGPNFNWTLDDNLRNMAPYSRKGHALERYSRRSSQGTSPSL